MTPQTLTSDDPGLYERGNVVWHSSDEGGLPDVGISVGLGEGRMLYAGEVADATLAQAGPDFTDSPSSWALVIFGQNSTNVIAHCPCSDAAQRFVEEIATLVRNVAGERAAA